jgi:hypothetical protein
MPSESDWILWGPYNFDLALIRNPLIYELSTRIGRYAVRTRFVEVFLNTNGGSLSRSDYFGVYALMEKIKRDEDRVDVEKLFPDHDQEPEVTGGYILKIDRADPGDSGFNGAGRSLRYVYPKEELIERTDRDAQQQYLRDFFSRFNSALNGNQFKNPQTGYAKYIDVEAAIDHHLLNVLAFNVDALRLSTYMSIPRNGKLTFGPIWDFDRAMGSTDGRDSDPNVWRARNGDRGTDFFNYPWWGRMFQDIDFFQQYIDRWQDLRRGQFQVEAIHGLIDSMANEVRESQVRNLDKWSRRPRSQFGGSYQGEINHLKSWFQSRIDFIDDQFVDAPLFSQNGGTITPGFRLALSSPERGSIYYTMDGSDPRSPGGQRSASAQLYQSPMTVNEISTVTARVFKSNHTSLTGSNNPPLTSLWSGPVQARFTIHDPADATNLTITEIHFHPMNPIPSELNQPVIDADEFEFIELRNVSASTIDLTGASFVNGISYTFPDDAASLVEPGDYRVLARNRDALESFYGTIEVATGVFEGHLANSGETLLLQDASGQTIVTFRYEDDWYPETDGLGYSLVTSKPNSVLNPSIGKETWRRSTRLGGSPGITDPDPLPGLVDLDEDGLPDSWEESFGLDSSNTEGDDGASGDPDNDGFNNAAEYLSGTNPTDPFSFLKFSQVQLTIEGMVEMEFQAAASITYRILYLDHIEEEDWNLLQEVPAKNVSDSIRILDTNIQTTSKRFYRLEAKRVAGE